MKIMMIYEDYKDANNDDNKDKEQTQQPPTNKNEWRGKGTTQDSEDVTAQFGACHHARTRRMRTEPLMYVADHTTEEPWPTS